MNSQPCIFSSFFLFPTFFSTFPLPYFLLPYQLFFYLFLNFSFFLSLSPCPLFLSFSTCPFFLSCSFLSLSSHLLRPPFPSLCHTRLPLFSFPSLHPYIVFSSSLPVIFSFHSRNEEMFIDLTTGFDYL